MEDVEAADPRRRRGVLPPVLRPGQRQPGHRRRHRRGPRRSTWPSATSATLPGGLEGAPALDARRRPWRAEASRRSLHDRVELDRLYLAWHTVPQFEPDDAAAGAPGRHPGPGQVEPALPQAGRRARGWRRTSASYQSGRELAGTFGVDVDPPTRPVVGGGPRPWSTPRSPRSPSAGVERGRAGAGQERPARRVHLRPGQRRRLRRRGRPAQRLQHLPRRPRPDHVRPRALPGRDGRGGPRGGRGATSAGRPRVCADGPRPEAGGDRRRRSTGRSPPAPAPAAPFRRPEPEVRTLALRRAALGPPAARPADRRRDGRPRRRGRGPRARTGAAWPA